MGVGVGYRVSDAAADRLDRRGFGEQAAIVEHDFPEMKGDADADDKPPGWEALGNPSPPLRRYYRFLGFHRRGFALEQ